MITSRAERSSERRRARVATVAMGVVLLFLAVYAVFSAVATSRLAESAAARVRTSDAVEQLKNAVLGEGALSESYALDPRPAVKALHQKAAVTADTALATLREEARGADRAAVERLAWQQGVYLRAVDRMFAVADGGRDDASTAALRAIDDAQVRPAYQDIEESTLTLSERRRQAAFQGLERLRTVENLIAWTTPPVFLLGLLLLLAYARVIDGYQRELDSRAHLDLLTRLPNRLQFGAEVAQAVASAQARDTRFAVMLLDLDRFKEINDTLGHSVGDRLLTQIGPRLRTVLRRDDVIGRFGGDEFAILVTDLSEATAHQVADRIMAALQEPFVLNGLPINVEASIGIATYPKDGRHAEELLQRADVAMYVAKQGRLGASEYDAERDDHSTGRLSLLGELRRGLGRDELVLHFQPVVGLPDWSLRSVEALVRWRHPVRGLIFPDEFIPTAESSGLIHDLSRYVLGLACRQAAAWLVGGERIPVAVNISARCLLDPELPETVAEVMAATRLPADLLYLEITESAIMVDPGRALEVLLRLRALGVELAIDDFGTGYTSMSYLRDLPVRELKIDRIFVQGMLSEPRDASIVQTMIEFAHRLGLTAVAEGIEDERTWDMLRDLGCDYAQGYLIGMPMPAPQLIEWVGRWRSATARDRPEVFPRGRE